MLVCFLNALATGIGGGGVIWRVCPFLQRVILWRMDGMKLGATLFCSPQIERNFELVPRFVPFVALEYGWNAFGKVSAVSRE